MDNGYTHGAREAGPLVDEPVSSSVAVAEREHGSTRNTGPFAIIPSAAAVPAHSDISFEVELSPSRVGSTG